MFWIQFLLYSLIEISFSLTCSHIIYIISAIFSKYFRSHSLLKRTNSRRWYGSWSTIKMLWSKYRASTFLFMGISSETMAYSCCYIDWRFCDYLWLPLFWIRRDQSLLLRVLYLYLFYITFSIYCFGKLSFVEL